MIAPLKPDDPHAIGPYHLFGRLGCGGMARVFLGLSADEQPVTVKVIRSELAADRDFRARFRQEVTSARKVNGPFTARIIDADLDGPVPWLATAYIAGPSLAEAVNSHGPLPVNKLLQLAAGLAESLVAIHAAGVVHRDLKPSNVLLAEDGPRVIDFGISRATGAGAAPGADLGSPAFMSPEHALGHVVGPPSDIFSMGAVLIFAATGRGPFGSGSSAALIYRLVNSPARLDGLPAELRGLVGNCLAKQPDDRPAASSLLMQVSAIQQQSGGLPEPGFNVFTQSERIIRIAGTSEVPAPAGVPPVTGPSVVKRPPGRAGRGLRHRVLRPLPLSVFGLVAALGVALFIISGAYASSPTLSQAGTTTTPRAQAQPQAVLPAPIPGATSHATATRGKSPSAGRDRTGSPIVQGSSAYSFLSPSPFAHTLPIPSPSVSTAPGDSPSASRSASASPSASKSPSTSASPSPAPSSSSSSPSAPATSTSSTSPSPSTSST